MEGEPKVGEIIAAKDKDSAKFYRAEVISKVDTEHFNVCFIDFGSWEIVHKKNIVKPSKLQVKTSFYFSVYNLIVNICLQILVM